MEPLRTSLNLIQFRGAEIPTRGRKYERNSARIGSVEIRSD